MNLSFENKVALVTGAALALVDINEEAVRGAAEKLTAAGHKARAIRCNVVDEAEVGMKTVD
jgi:hypothetical protein